MNLDSENENPSSWLASLEQISPELSPLHAHIDFGNSSSQCQMIPFLMEEGQISFNEQQPQLLPQNLLDDVQFHQQRESLGYVSTLFKQQSNVDMDRRHIQNLEGNITHLENLQELLNSIITLLIQNDQLSQLQLLKLGKPIYNNNKIIENIFRILIPKFKKLKKTKEQMTKFCMRKALKFASDMNTTQKKRKKSTKTEGSVDTFIIQMPFKKNSMQRTMNTQFLKQVFSQPQFLHSYKRFLQQFNTVVSEDNEAKIKYLSGIINENIKNNNIAQIEKIKRLPWTSSILKKAQELAGSLLKFSEPESSLI